MASSIARHTSTISLVSTASLPREGNLFVLTLSRYRDQLETACDKILDKCCAENKSGMAMGQSSQETTHAHSPRILEGKAREVLAQHLIELLSSLVLPEPLPQTIKDVDARLAEGQLCFPDKLIPTEAELDAFRALSEKGKKASSASLNLPVDKIFIALKELTGRFNHSTCIYITAVTEKVISNFLKMVIYYEESVQVERVIRAATIQNLFHIYRDRVKSQRRHPDPLLTDSFPQDYNKCVDELVAFLSSSLEQMNLILRVFREPILHSASASLDSNSEEAAIQEVFGEALDLYNNFRLLLDYLESDCTDESPFSSSECPASNQQQQALPDSCHSIVSAPTENRRLVGRLLFEPAEDIALASYSSSPERFKSIWRLSERPEVLESLARLSRVIVHTVARLKATSSDVVEPRLVCSHSLCCPSCRLWDQKEFSLLATATTATKGTMSSACQCNTVVTCFRYLLPRLLLLPIFQFLHFYRLVNALHQRAYDATDREFLFHVVDVLIAARLDLERVLVRYPGLYVQLARLVTTGHLFSPQTPPNSAVLSRHSHSAQSSGITPRHRSYSASPAVTMTPHAHRDSSAHHHRSSTPPPQSPLITALTTVFCAGGGSGGSYVATTACSGTPTTTVPEEEHPESVMSSLMGGGVYSAMTQAKLEELERLTGGKERFLTTAAGIALGKFVMEGRLMVKDEGKRAASERQAYLFTNCLVLCKRLERRSTLAPSVVGVVGAQPLLRVKRRLPLEAIHVIDLTTSNQPQFDSYAHTSNSFTECATGGVCVSRTVTDSNQHAALDGLDQYSFILEFLDANQRQLSATPEGYGSGDSGIGCSTAPGALSNHLLLNVDDPPLGVQFHCLHLEAQSPEEKADWMASLLSISTSRIYERYLRTLPKLEIPLRLPPPEKYRFSQPDTPFVIVFEPPTGKELSSSSSTNLRLLQPPPSPKIRSSFTATSADDHLDSLDVVVVPTDDLEDDVEVVDVDLFSRSPTDDESLGGVAFDEASSFPLPSSTSSRIHSPHLSPQVITPATGPNPSTHTGPHRPQIQFATLEKLVERLTYPTYFDAVGVNAFLLTYRRFITPEQLLDLLVERFNVPNPEFSSEECEAEGVVERMMRRFRSGYKRRVQARVITFLSLWARSPRYFAYDFAPNAALRARLATFLASVSVRCLLPAVQAIEHRLARADTTTPEPLTAIFAGTLRPEVRCGAQQHPLPLNLAEATTDHPASATPPLSPSPSETQEPQIDLLQIHPLELAEQVTLREFDFYRRIKFWEVDGRNRSPQDSPNLTAYKEFSNKFRNWLVHSILSERHPEDRVVAIQRVIDLMVIFEHHRNLQGYQEAKAALFSASVFRLKKAFQAVSRVRSYRDLVRRLRFEGQGLARRSTKSGRAPDSADTHHMPTPASSLSPCVPYIARGVITPLIHLEVRHPDRVNIDGAPDDSADVLINFSKQRRLAEIVESFLCHQRIPYAFPVNQKLQRALAASLDIFAADERDFEARMFALSEVYEPRDTSSEPLHPTQEVERRLGKEAIQAANYLAGLPLREKLLHDHVASYKAHLCPRQRKFDRRASSPRLSCPPTPSPLPSDSASPEQRVVALWTTRLQQHRAGQQHQTLGAASTVRPFSSPSAGPATEVLHCHSISDSQMENLSNSRLVSCGSSGSGENLHDIPALPPPPLSEGSVRRRPPPPPTSPIAAPPPLPPPRRQSNCAPSSPTSASHSPSPLFPLMAPPPPPQQSIEIADGSLPPLPPKPGQRTPTMAAVVVALSPPASSTSHPRQFFDAHSDTVTQTPPLPPRQHMSCQ